MPLACRLDFNGVGVSESDNELLTRLRPNSVRKCRDRITEKTSVKIKQLILHNSRFLVTFAK